MGYHGWIEGDCADDDVDLGDMTSNLAPMFRHALSAVSGTDTGLIDVSGLRTERTLPLFDRAVHHMLLNPQEYRPMRPTNGWGTYEDAVVFFTGVRDACRDHAGVVRWAD